MRKVFNKTALLMFALASITATSCLKDKGYENGDYGSLNGRTEGQEFVSIPASSRVGNKLDLSLESKAGTQNIPLFALSYDAKDPAPSDFTATLALNNALITDPGLTVLPASTYTFTTLDLPFKAGRRFSDSLMLNVNTSTLDPSKQYALGFTLQSVSKAGVIIPSNLKNLIVTFSVKNRYDGVYKVISGKVTRYTAPGVPQGDVLSGNLAGQPDVKLITTGPNTVLIPPPANPNPGALYWAYPNASQVAGIDPLTLTINPTTNEVTVTSAQNATLTNWVGSAPGITYNRYDPVTKRMYLAFRWNPTSTVREYEIVLEYKGPR